MLSESHRLPCKQSDAGGPIYIVGMVFRPTFLDATLVHQARKVFEGAIIGALGVVWEAAARQLFVFEVVADTFTTHSFTRAGFIAAVAYGQVLFFFTFHKILLVVLNYG
jgi:hypothetical protein